MATTLGELVTEVVESHVIALVNRIQSQWSSVDQGEYTEHDIVLRRFTPSKNMVRIGLDFVGLGAFILEYGSGSLMVTNVSDELGDFGNPDLVKYLNSSWFNKERLKHGNAITGRAKGEKIHSPKAGVEDRTSSGAFKGLNLEQPVKKIKKPPLVPQEPLHIVETEMIHWAKELEEDISTAVELWVDQQMESAFKGMR